MRAVAQATQHIGGLSRTGRLAQDLVVQGHDSVRPNDDPVRIESRNRSCLLSAQASHQDPWRVILTVPLIDVGHVHNEGNTQQL
jgi:hypothetical protein